VSWRDPFVQTPYGRVRASNLEDVRRQREAWAGERIPRKRRRGRPPDLGNIRSPEAVRDAYRVALAEGWPTQERVAERLAVSVTALKAYLTRHGMTWPPG
jgi:hypothetical protein